VTPIANGVGDCTVGAKSDAYSPVVQRNPDALVATARMYAIDESIDVTGA
jgi:hypothetical protein